MAIFSRFFGRTVGEGAGVAIGTATANVVEPALQELANAARAQYPHIPIDPETAAALVARETVAGYPGIDLDGVEPETEAAFSGVKKRRFDKLVALAREHPSVAELLRLRRRNLAFGGDHGISRENYREWLRRQGFTTEVIDALTKLLTEYLPPADIANAVQQGFVPGDHLLPPPESGGPPFEPPVEVVNIDATDEAQVFGLDEDRLRVLAELSGNPPGPETLLELWNRKAITETAVERGIREGRTKTKWTPALKELAKRLLPPNVIVNLRLRGWIDDDSYRRRMALHGFDDNKADDWYHATGRPITLHQAMLGLRRGGVYGAPLSDTPQPFRDAVIRSDIRPEWAHLLYMGRETYPSAFVVRRLVEAGALDADGAYDVLYKAGWNPELARAAATAFAGGTGTSSKGLTAGELTAEYEGLYIDRTEYVHELQQLGYGAAQAEARAEAADARRTKTYRDAAIRAVHKRYLLHRADAPEARASLVELSVPDGAIDLLLTLWSYEREAKAAVLTPAQVKKAFREDIFTRDRAMAELQARGYDADDARVLLDE